MQSDDWQAPDPKIVGLNSVLVNFPKLGVISVPSSYLKRCPVVYSY